MAEKASPPTRSPAPAPGSGHGTDSVNIVVKAAGLTKVFRDFWLRSRVRAVDRIDLDVRRGEVFGLLGPNGSGKSTTIKMILGLLYPTAGRVAVFGRPAADVAIKKRIGYLPEESYFYRFLNARETLEYYGRLFGQDRRQRQHRTNTLLEMVGLDRVARRPLGEYSKGMQRRIGLAQALINDPALLILDEPTTGLDPIGTRQIKDLILEMARRGKTILLCSHLLADVEDVCDRVAIMFGGRIRKQGTVDQLLVQDGMMTIHAPAMDSKVIEEIEHVLERHGRHIERVEQPRQKLEALFLQIVHEAQAEGAATSGAQSDGKIADFLTAELAHMPESIDAGALIDELTREARPGPGAGVVSSPAPAADLQQRDPVDANIEVIDRLIDGFGGAKATSQEPPQLPTTAPLAPTEPEAPPVGGQTPPKTNVQRLLAEKEQVVTDEDVELPKWAEHPRSEEVPNADRAPPANTGSDDPDAEQPDKGFLDALIDVDPVPEDEPAADEDDGGDRTHLGRRNV